MTEIEEEQNRIQIEEVRLQQPSSEASGELDRLRYDNDFHKLIEYVGIDNEKAKKLTDKLNFLMEWSRTKAKSKDIVDSLYELKKLRDGLGFNEVGETAVNKLYTYLRLSNEQSRIFADLKRIKKEKELLKS